MDDDHGTRSSRPGCDRRTFVRAIAGAGVLALAGCTTTGSDTGPGPAGSDAMDGTTRSGSMGTPSATDTSSTGETGSMGGEPMGDTATATATTRMETEMDGTTAASTRTTASDLAAWRTTALGDVASGESFTVQEFRGRPVLLEAFAVWCPVCTSQQEAIAALLEEEPEVVAIRLNTDPNESAEKVRAHRSDHGFDWRYAVSPPAMTRSLVEEFGTVITNPPSAPVVRVCPGGDASLVGGRGVKSAGRLTEAFDGC